MFYWFSVNRSRIYSTFIFWNLFCGRFMSFKTHLCQKQKLVKNVTYLTHLKNFNQISPSSSPKNTAFDMWMCANVNQFRWYVSLGIFMYLCFLCSGIQIWVNLHSKLWWRWKEAMQTQPTTSGCSRISDLGVGGNLGIGGQVNEKC